MLPVHGGISFSPVYVTVMFFDAIRKGVICPKLFYAAGDHDFAADDVQPDMASRRVRAETR